MKLIKPNSPESFAICRRAGEEDRRIHGRLPVTFTPQKERKHKPSSEWKPRVVITPEIISKVIRLADEGKSLPEIAREANVSRATAARIKARRGKYG